MKKEKAISSIRFVLSCLDTFEYTDLCNDLIDSDIADIRVPKIRYMKELKNFKNEKVDSFNEDSDFFIINGEQKLESIVSPLEIVKFNTVASFILENDIRTNYSRINAIVDDYWNSYDNIRNFLKNIPDSSLLTIWNDYQKEIRKENFIYRKELFDEIVSKVKPAYNGVIHIDDFDSSHEYFIIYKNNFTSSNEVCKLISICDLFNYFG